jgi:hypothetical protein
MKTRYAIKLMLATDDWIYLTEPSGTMFEVNPVLYKSRKEAEVFANSWRKKGKEACVKVVRYRGETT